MTNELLQLGTWRRCLGELLSQKRQPDDFRSWSRTSTIVLLCSAVLIAFAGCSRSNQESVTATASPSPKARAADWLPTPAELPDDFLMQGDQNLTIGEYTAGWSDASTYYSRLRDWGFESAVRRVSWINPALATSQSDAMTSLTATSVALESEDAAIDASETMLSMLMEVEGLELQRVETDLLGDFTLAAVGTSTVQGQVFDVAFVWVVNGPILVSYQGLAVDYEPLVDVLGIAEATSERMQSVMVSSMPSAYTRS